MPWTTPEPLSVSEPSELAQNPKAHRRLPKPLIQVRGRVLVRAAALPSPGDLQFLRRERPREGAAATAWKYKSQESEVSRS